MSTAAGAGPLRFAVPERHRFRELQALEDAVNYRLARLMAPCARCEPGLPDSRCDEHACDVALIAGYLEAARATMAALSRATSSRRAGRAPVARGDSDGHGA
ncbi:MAG TPA: hypothetical protein VMV92_03640 [Streptosporangiaceae bacterium]|nr:hypothetical protein [Streptosporangiaceae bacterium]